MAYLDTVLEIVSNRLIINDNKRHSVFNIVILMQILPTK